MPLNGYVCFYISVLVSGSLQLCSADSRLADRCLADDLQLVWSPSVSLSSADISSCLQTSSTQATEGSEAGGLDHAAVDTLQQCGAGYGVGEIIPSSMANKYVFFTRCSYMSDCCKLNALVALCYVLSSLLNWVKSAKNNHCKS